jgi:hypothetical protein
MSHNSAVKCVTFGILGRKILVSHIRHFNSRRFVFPSLHIYSIESLKEPTVIKTLISPKHTHQHIMPIVPHWSISMETWVNAIQRSENRENLPDLNPGPGLPVDKTAVTWFKFLHNLWMAIPDILRAGWVHEWPTYRFIPDHFKERWFFILAVSTEHICHLCFF